MPVKSTVSVMHRILDRIINSTGAVEGLKKSSSGTVPKLDWEGDIGLDSV